MGRWAPVGLQRLIENVQHAFIAYSDGEIEAGELDRVLRERHQQLNRAAEASRAIVLDVQLRPADSDESIAASQALPVTAVAVPAVA